ncbi:MAG: Manganese transport system membrane protein MntB [Chlamydiae bacterium]|nr:Manganese transport system membrane protein MntB [Chlamydiota bacterium]
MLEFFTNPILRAPTIGCMLMCFSAGLIGCLVFLQKRSLVGESLSHAAYPGVVIAIFFSAVFFPFSEEGAALSIMLGAFISGLLGLVAISQLQKRLKISSDAALCFVLSIFFGIGVLIASHLQVTHALWFRQIQVFLFGQAATMVDAHITLYAALTTAVLTAVILLFRFLEILNFDPDFAKSVRVRTTLIDGIMSLLLVLAIVVGMRCVGVVLMSAMLIAPAVAARQWTKKLGSFFALSGLIGALSGFLGNAFSLWIPKWSGQPHLALPTGPMIVLTAAALALFSLLFAPQKGFVTRMLRITRFRIRCKQENLLKALYKGQTPPMHTWLHFRMRMKGWIRNGELTALGQKEGENLVRLHRLWEVYLVHMGQGEDRVHHNAEEMEHILTPEIESQLQSLLNHPQTDPHAQPIPKGGRL